jgi:uncharacterized membrane protein YfcA
VIGAFTPGEAALVVAAGFAAGAINAAVGSGSLVTFPTLVALGVPPITANVSNTIGLVPGSLASIHGYRRELRGHGPLVRRLLSATVIGALTGTALLLLFPPAVFEAVVPALVAAAVVLVLLQPWVARRAALAAGRGDGSTHQLTDQQTDQQTGQPTDQPTAQIGGQHPGQPRWLWPAIALTGVYGAYFGAAQGVLLIGVLGLGTVLGLQSVNGVKNVLAGSANLVAGLVFAVVAPVDWTAAGLVAVGAVLGGVLGARVARRLPVPVLRGVVVAVGVVALVSLLA